MQHAGGMWSWASDAIVWISTITQYWESGNICSYMVVNAIASSLPRQNFHVWPQTRQMHKGRTSLPRQNFHTWPHTRQMHQGRLVIVSKNDTCVQNRLSYWCHVSLIFYDLWESSWWALCLAAWFEVLRVALLGKDYVVGHGFRTFHSSPGSTAQTRSWRHHNPSKHQLLKPRIFPKAWQIDKMEITTYAVVKLPGQNTVALWP